MYHRLVFESVVSNAITVYLFREKKTSDSSAKMNEPKNDLKLSKAIDVGTYQR